MWSYNMAVWREIFFWWGAIFLVNMGVYVYIDIMLKGKHFQSRLIESLKALYLIPLSIIKFTDFCCCTALWMFIDDERGHNISIWKWQLFIKIHVYVRFDIVLKTYHFQCRLIESLKALYLITCFIFFNIYCFFFTFFMAISWR